MPNNKSKRNWRPAAKALKLHLGKRGGGDGVGVNISGGVFGHMHPDSVYFPWTLGGHVCCDDLTMCFKRNFILGERK